MDVDIGCYTHQNMRKIAYNSINSMRNERILNSLKARNNEKIRFLHPEITGEIKVIRARGFNVGSLKRETY